MGLGLGASAFMPACSHGLDHGLGVVWFWLQWQLVVSANTRNNPYSYNKLLVLFLPGRHSSCHGLCKQLPPPLAHCCTQRGCEAVMNDTPVVALGKHSAMTAAVTPCQYGWY